MAHGTQVNPTIQTYITELHQKWIKFPLSCGKSYFYHSQVSEKHAGMDLMRIK